jgi:hypothetical protein
VEDRPGPDPTAVANPDAGQQNNPLGQSYVVAHRYVFRDVNTSSQDVTLAKVSGWIDSGLEALARRELFQHPDKCKTRVRHDYEGTGRHSVLRPAWVRHKHSARTATERRFQITRRIGKYEVALFRVLNGRDS